MSGVALEAVLRRDRAVIVACLIALTALAWADILWLSHGMERMPMADMPRAHAWSMADFVFVFAMWAVMMVGMMTPSAAPMILIYARIGRQAVARGKPLAATGIFAAGYLLAWILFSLLATAGQWGLEQALLLTPMMASASNALSGAILIGAGLYQWSAQKNACLTQCQAPVVFIQRHGGFRRDRLGSLALGFRHGLYCIGCCWALMALLFVIGVMNVIWIAALSAFVLVEKIVPAGRLLPRATGLVLIGAGVALLASAYQRL